MALGDSGALPESDSACAAFVSALLQMGGTLSEIKELLRSANLSLESLLLVVMAMEQLMEPSDASQVSSLIFGRCLELSDQSLSSDATMSRLLKAVARVFVWDVTVVDIITPLAEHDKLWAESETNVLKFRRLCTILQHVLEMATERKRPPIELYDTVLPIFLNYHMVSDRIAEVRIRSALPILHLFFRNAATHKHIERLWATVEGAHPTQGLVLLCRVIESVPTGLQEWLRTPAFWNWVYQHLSNHVALKSGPMSVWKQALFILREALEACNDPAKGPASLEQCSPWMQWSKKEAKATLKDWDGWITLLEALEQSALSFVEPVWPILEKISLAHRLPSVWIQLVVNFIGRYLISSFTNSVLSLGPTGIGA